MRQSIEGSLYIKAHEAHEVLFLEASEDVVCQAIEVCICTSMTPISVLTWMEMVFRFANYSIVDHRFGDLDTCVDQGYGAFGAT